MGVFTTGGFRCQCGVYNGCNPSLFGETSFGPAYFITRAESLLRVRMIYYACGYFIRRAAVRLRLSHTDMTQCYVKRLYYCFRKLIRVYKVGEIHDIIKWKMSEYLTN